MSAAEMLAGAAPDHTPDWHSIEWKKAWRTVRRLQARIVKAVAEGRWNKVKALVYLLTHSFSGRALAILRVISNSGAKTPGVDGILWNTPEAKSAAFGTLRRHGYQPQPLRRVYILSHVLANWTLDGLQRLLAERFANTPQHRKNKVHLVRYADDFLITGISKELLRDQVQPLVAHFLKERGLELSHEKTQITHVEEGFDFLGQHVRRYRCGKVFTKPSLRNVQTFLTKIQDTIDGSGSSTAG